MPPTRGGPRPSYGPLVASLAVPFFVGLLILTSSSFAAEPSQIPIEFLSGSDARTAIVDETNDPYFKLLQPMEMTVKTGSPVPGDTLEQQRDECRKRYQQAVQQWTVPEQEALRWYVSIIAPATRQYPLFARTPWSFIKIGPQIEGRMPFTRGRHIVLPSTILGDLVLKRKDATVANLRSNAEWIALAQYGEILVHEQCHIVQRQHPEPFARLYTEYWGFKHAAQIKSDDWLSEHQLLDPDAVDTRWVFPIHEGQRTRWIWPLSVLEDPQDPSGPSFRDARMISVQLNGPTDGDEFQVKLGGNGRLVSQALMNERAYVDLFRPSGDVYHPNEASADLFARIVTDENLLPGRAPDEAREALKKAKIMLEPLQKWFEKIMVE